MRGLSDRAKPAALDAAAVQPLKHFTVRSQLIRETDYRFDAQAFIEETVRAAQSLRIAGWPTVPLGSQIAAAYHPTESQPRSNFKRIWVAKDEGKPFLAAKELFFFRPSRERFLSLKMDKLPELSPTQGSLLLSRSGAIGHPVYVGRRLSEYAVSDDAIRVIPQAGTGVPAGYVYAYLSSTVGRTLLAKSQYGATVKHLEAKHLKETPIPLLPAEAQASIDEAVRHAYELRDSANDDIDKALRLLQEGVGLPILEEEKPVAEGDVEPPLTFSVLVSELSERLDGAYHRPVVTRAIAGVVNCGHGFTSLGDACHITIPGRFKRNFVDDSSQGVPFFKPSYLPMIRPWDIKYISKKQAASMSEYMLSRGDVLVSTDGTVGRIGLVSDLLEGWFGSNNVGRIRSDVLDHGYIVAFLMSPYGQHQLNREIYGGVIDHINEEHIAEVLIPTPPMTVQRQIGSLITGAFVKRDSAISIEDGAIRQLEDHLAGTSPKA